MQEPVRFAMRTAQIRFAVRTTLSAIALAGCSRAVIPAAGYAPEHAADGPGHWERQTVASNASCRSVSAASALVAWAGCSGGRVFRTVDGGTTWMVDTVPGAARLDFRGI